MAENKRTYNVFFDLHSVSGIVISIGLFVIFFCGAFALLRDEISVWEKHQPIEQLYSHEEVNIDQVIAAIEDADYPLHQADMTFYWDENHQYVNARLDYNHVIDSVDLGDKKTFFKVDTKSGELLDYIESYNYGEFLYRLHFFAQMPYIGMYLAGFISLFFLFATITGIVIHWDKMFKNFWLFRPKKKLKTLFTDAHTALGFIGLPFQIMYAVTGAFFCLSIVALLPALFVYDNDQEALFEDFRSGEEHYLPVGDDLATVPPLQSFFDAAEDLHPKVDFHQIAIKSYGDENMHVVIHGNGDDKKFISTANLTYRVNDGELLMHKSPEEFDVRDSGFGMVMAVLHFAEFGGVAMKLIYFLLAMITAFVIISGVLIWLEARNKKNITPKQARKNKRVERWYLAISYALIVITALTFNIVLFLRTGSESSIIVPLYAIFFISWLALSIVGYFIYDRAKLAKYSFAVSGLLFLTAIILQAIMSGDFALGKLDSVTEVNLFLLVSALCCFMVSYFVRSKTTA